MKDRDDNDPIIGMKKNREIKIYNILLCFFREIKIHIPLPLEDAWDEDKEPRDEDEDMDNVEADKTFNWDSN